MIESGTLEGLVFGALFTGLVVAAAVLDVRTRRIPNKLVLTLLAMGLLASLLVWTPLAGLQRFGAGLLAGFAIWIPFWLFRWLGAGDVKLMAAAGGWLGASGVLEASVFAALLGGALTIGWLVWERGWSGMATTMYVGTVSPKILRHSTHADKVKHRVPYGVALAGGVLLAAWIPGLLSRA